MDNKQWLVVFAILIFLSGCADNSPVVGPYPKAGLASWYVARRTATGERYKSQDLTCAMRKFGFGKHYRVCNNANNKCVVVRHNNFGPARHLYEVGRVVDLSKAAFSQIADLKEGIIKVTLEEVK